MKRRYNNQTCFEAVMFGKKAVLLCHKNLTVKIDMPLQDYKAQYSVKSNIYICIYLHTYTCIYISFLHLFLLHRRIGLCGSTALQSEALPPDRSTH